ncbi:UDP-glucuronic acid decarboxylase family protein [Herbaspirillum rubrisubalbicans]|uniref:NAD-dependent epimerase/dehydratase family protein n=1 Tax=Herbaspirillum rubrisubalbicans TaxID=80842 RepID=A0AAD0U7N8_9BURK|nr:UDP-glucuronic acid decarboxylase family protein [Herbaspirillum rubrisubalbicans]AYR23382.1 NAD-dependent epimerase/dehydratase family protein [Herbaspirillum rubrisubalbicans]
MDKRVLVTGGAGFLGSHLCEALLAAGNTVLCLDNFYTGSERNVEHLLSHERFELIPYDVTLPLDVDVDLICNLASPASPVHYQSDPVQTLKTNLEGAANMLKLAKRINAKVFQASTSEVYGDPEITPQPEWYWGNVNPIGVRSCYDEGKRCAETLFFDYHRQYRVPIKVARIFNTYGPRMRIDDGRVISNFIVQALLGEPITVYGDGMQTRSFCFVSDLIDAIVKFLQTSDVMSGPINLGNPEEIPMQMLAEKIIAMTGSRSQIIHQRLPEDDPRQRRPDITVAKKLLNWSPQIDLESGLVKTIEYFESELLRIGRAVNG